MAELPLHPTLKNLLLSPDGSTSHYKSIGHGLGLTNFSEATPSLMETNPDGKGLLHFFLRDVNKTYHKAYPTEAPTSQLSPEQTTELLVFLTVFTGGERDGYYFATHNEILFYSYWVLSTLGLSQEVYVPIVHTLLPILLDLREQLSSTGIPYFCPSKSSLGLSIEAYTYYKDKLQELQSL